MWKRSCKYYNNKVIIKEMTPKMSEENTQGCAACILPSSKVSWTHTDTQLL